MSLFNRSLSDGQRAVAGMQGTHLMTAAGGAYTGLSLALLVPLADTTFTTLTDDLRSGAAITGVTFPKGVPIPGNITAVTIASGGPVLGYKQ